MQTPDTFLGLSGTGWTGVASIISALSIVALVMYNQSYLTAAVQGIKAQLLGIEAGLFSACPVLTLRKEHDGRFSVYNCGQGPALMAQWAYGESAPESTVEDRLDDNIIPAGDFRPINLDLDRARSTGLLLFAYSVTNDQSFTTIKWPRTGGERYVHFGIYRGKLPVPK